MSPQEKLCNYTSLRRQNLGHCGDTLAFQGHREGNIQKNLIRTSFRQSVCIQLCQQQASHLLQEEEEISKISFHQDRVNPQFPLLSLWRGRLQQRPCGSRATCPRTLCWWWDLRDMARSQLSFWPCSSTLFFPKSIHHLAQCRWPLVSW